MTDLYQDLGVPRDADDAQIKRAYRRKAAKAHPDAGGSREEFEKVNQAKIVLLDPRRRAKYDTTGETDTNPDNEMSEIINIVMGAIDTKLGECERAGRDPTTVDLLASARLVINNQIEGQQAQIKSLDLGAKQIRKLAERMKAKKGDNRLRPVFESRAIDIERRAAAARQDIERRKKAYDLLKNHEFDFEKSAANLQAGLGYIDSLGRPFGGLGSQSW